MILKIRREVWAAAVLVLFGLYVQVSANDLRAGDDIERSIRIGASVFYSGSPTYIPLLLDSAGGEHSVSFSVNWGPGSMRYVRMESTTTVPADTTLAINTSQILHGRIGLRFSSEAGFPPGPKRLGYLVGFGYSASRPFTISVVNTPTPIEVLDGFGQPMDTRYFGANYSNIPGESPLRLYAPDVSVTAPGETVTVPIRFATGFTGFDGTTNVSFSLQWDPEKLEYQGAQLGSLLPFGTTMTLDESLLASGRLGASFTGTSAFLDSTLYNLLNLSLKVRPSSPVGYYSVSFGSEPTRYAASDILGNLRTTAWNPGFVDVGQLYASITGFVYSPNVTPLINMPVVLTDEYGISRSTVTSSPFGIFQFTSVPVGSKYTITVNSKRFRFAPVQVSMTGSNISNLSIRGLE